MRTQAGPQTTSSLSMLTQQWPFMTSHWNVLVCLWPCSKPYRLLQILLDQIDRTWFTFQGRQNQMASFNVLCPGIVTKHFSSTAYDSAISHIVGSLISKVVTSCWKDVIDSSEISTWHFSMIFWVHISYLNLLWISGGGIFRQTILKFWSLVIEETNYFYCRIVVSIWLCSASDLSCMNILRFLTPVVISGETHFGWKLKLCPDWI